MPFLAPYVAAKHAVVGICRSLANELAGQAIRVNTVHPAGVDTPMVAGLETLEPFISRSPELGAIFANSLPVEAVDPRDVSNAVLYLASDDARYVTALRSLSTLATRSGDTPLLVRLQLNAGVPAPEIARRAGHGVAVLLRVYAGCIDDQEQLWNGRIDDALRDDDTL